MRSAIALGLGIVLFGLAGCAAPSSQEAGVEQQGGRVALLDGSTAHLLFDRHPSQVYSPQSFTYRAAWPQVENGLPGGEVTEYQEYFVDRERDFPSFYGRTYRRFVTRRTGVSFR